MNLAIVIILREYLINSWLVFVYLYAYVNGFIVPNADIAVRMSIV